MSGNGRDFDRRMIAGRYELRKVLGRGGMATVYRAYQAALDRFVAIKLIDPRLASDLTFVERFRLEARIAARLRHPNLLTIFDFGDDNGTLYLVTELIEGGTLQARLGEINSFAVAIDLIEQIGAALDFAHTQEIVHRDVKPANVFLEGDRAILADFGIAKVLSDTTDAGLTATGTGVGTPEYMAPEQLLGQQIDGRADLYALAVILYRILAGRLPYRLEGPNDTTLALVMRKVNDPPTPPSAFNPAISPTLDAIMIRALARDPTARYPTAAAFIGAVRGALGLRPAAMMAHTVAPTATVPNVSPGYTDTRTSQILTQPGAGYGTPIPPANLAGPATTTPGRRAPRSATPLLFGGVAILALLIIAVAAGAFVLSRSGGDVTPTSASRPSPTAPIIAFASGTATAAPTTRPITPAPISSSAPATSPPAATRATTTATLAPTAQPIATPESLIPIATMPPTVAPTAAPTTAPTVAPTPAPAPTATPTSPPPPPTAPPPVANVRETAQTAILSLPGTSSGVFVNLTNSADNYSDEPGRIFPAASMIKLPIAGAAYQRVADGQWKLTDILTLTDAVKVGGTGIVRNQPAGTTYTLDKLIEIMLINSDNTAANMIVDKLGGFGPVNTFSQAQGMGNTIMRRKLYDLAAQSRGVENTTTTGDIARFFLRLQSGDLLQRTYADRLRTILAQRGQQDKNWALLNLPPNTIALHMTGTGAGTRNDAIFVTVGEKQYLLVLMVTDPNEAGIEAALARVSATLYNATIGR